MKSDWSESRIQKTLASHFNKTGSLCVPNCGAFGWESDLIRILPSMFAYEYEIKISLSDFRKDASKGWKHRQLSGEHPSGHESGRCPQRFFYVAPPGIVAVAELPSHAGLIEIHGRKPKLVRQAPKLHGLKVRPRELMYIARGAAFRYWTLASEESTHVQV